jgi:hypothetical protein
MPRGLWSPLFLASRHALVDHGGVIGFFHDYFRRAVQLRYVPSEEDVIEVHRRLAGYFAARANSPRRIEELPWQLAEAKDWSRLADLLADLTFVSAAWGQQGQTIRAFRALVEQHISGAVLTAYQPVLDDPNKYLDALSRIWSLFSWLDYPKQSLQLLGGAIDLLDRFDAEYGGFTVAFRRAFSQLCSDSSYNHMRLGDLETAFEVADRAASVCGDDPEARAVALGARGAVLAGLRRSSKPLPTLRMRRRCSVHRETNEPLRRSCSCRRH